MTRFPAFAAFLLLTAAGSAAAAPKAAGPISVSGVWSRPATAGLPTGVAYLTLTDQAPAADRLVSASSPKAGRVSLHHSVLKGGVMSMLAVPDGLDLPPGYAVTLAPGGYHLMLEGLKGGLKVGETYPLTLRFAHARPMTIQVQVRPGPDPMAGMKMPQR